MEKNIMGKDRIKERKRQTKIVPKGEASFMNKPNYELMARAYIDFYHKTKHYL